MKRIEALPKATSENIVKEWKYFIDILKYLRSDVGCPWDQQQTLESLRPHIIEEPTELLEAIGNYLETPSPEKKAHLREELGDVFLVITMMIVLYEEDHEKDGLSHILSDINEKLIRRHPHVFGEVNIENEEQLASQWNSIKQDVEGKKKESIDKYKNYMHVLERSKAVQKRMQKDHGILTENLKEKTTQLAYMIQSMSDFYDELNSLDEYSPSPDHFEKAIGDALFSLVDIARTLKVSPTAALSRKLAFELEKL